MEVRVLIKAGKNRPVRWLVSVITVRTAKGVHRHILQMSMHVFNMEVTAWRQADKASFRRQRLKGILLWLVDKVLCILTKPQGGGLFRSIYGGMCILLLVPKNFVRQILLSKTNTWNSLSHYCLLVTKLHLKRMWFYVNMQHSSSLWRQYFYLHMKLFSPL